MSILCKCICAVRQYTMDHLYELFLLYVLCFLCTVKWVGQHATEWQTSYADLDQGLGQLIFSVVHGGCVLASVDVWSSFICCMYVSD